MSLIPTNNVKGLLFFSSPLFYFIFTFWGWGVGAGFDPMVVPLFFLKSGFISFTVECEFQCKQLRKMIMNSDSNATKTHHMSTAVDHTLSKLNMKDKIHGTGKHFM